MTNCVEYLEQYTFPCPPSCTGCKQPIRDEFILRVQGHLWHAQCLQCEACKKHLTHTCYVRGSSVFCQMDFYRLFGASCAGCADVIPPSDVVRRANDNIYHTRCFVCVICGVALNTGDEFYLRDDLKLICKVDFHNADLDNAADHPDQSGGDPQQVASAPSGSVAGPTFTPQEMEVLQELHRSCANPSHDTLQSISSQHGLDLNRVRVWFHLHRKQKEHRNCGTVYGAGCSYGDAAGVMERAVAPPGGYPLPIVNDVSSKSSGGLPPASSRSDIMSGDVPFPMTSASVPKPLCPQWPLSEDMWRSDYVPPNVNLDPSDIKDGEVCDRRRGFPAAVPVSTSSTGQAQYKAFEGPQPAGQYQPPCSQYQPLGSQYGYNPISQPGAVTNSYQQHPHPSRPPHPHSTHPQQQQPPAHPHRQQPHLLQPHLQQHQNQQNLQNQYQQQLQDDLEQIPWIDC